MHVALRVRVRVWVRVSMEKKKSKVAFDQVVRSCKPAVCFLIATITVSYVTTI